MNTGNMFSFPDQQGDANQNHNEISYHPCWNSYQQKDKTQ